MFKDVRINIDYRLSNKNSKYELINMKSIESINFEPTFLLYIFEASISRNSFIFSKIECQ